MGYYLNLLTPERMPLLKNTNNKKTKDINGENVPYFQITEVGLVHYNIINNYYQQNSRNKYTFTPNVSLGQ